MNRPKSGRFSKRPYTRNPADLNSETASSSPLSFFAATNRGPTAREGNCLKILDISRMCRGDWRVALPVSVAAALRAGRPSRIRSGVRTPPRRKSESGVVPGFRRDNAWIPAFAGMTTGAEKLLQNLRMRWVKSRGGWLPPYRLLLVYSGCRGSCERLPLVFAHTAILSPSSF